MRRHPDECATCSAGQRLSTLTFAVFAALLAGGALDPDETTLRQGALGICAALSALAVFRHPVGALVARRLQRKRVTQRR